MWGICCNVAPCFDNPSQISIARDNLHVSFLAIADGGVEEGSEDDDDAAVLGDEGRRDLEDRIRGSSTPLLRCGATMG